MTKLAKVTNRWNGSGKTFVIVGFSNWSDTHTIHRILGKQVLLKEKTSTSRSFPHQRVQMNCQSQFEWPTLNKAFSSLLNEYGFNSATPPRRLLRESWTEILHPRYKIDFEPTDQCIADDIKKTYCPRDDQCGSSETSFKACLTLNRMASSAFREGAESMSMSAKYQVKTGVLHSSLHQLVCTQNTFRVLTSKLPFFRVESAEQMIAQHDTM